MEQLEISLPHTSYPIYCDTGLLDQLPSLLRRHRLDGSLYLITDEQVAGLYRDRVLQRLQADSRSALSFHTVVGEGAKTQTVADHLYTWLIQNGADRKSVILALGGGVIGDLAGYVAATFMRGIRFVQVPTTLLAQVDSSVGGKVAINHPLAKNLIGAFYHPQFVLMDPLLLKTLEDRQIRSGMAEVVKYGCMGDLELFASLKRIWLELIDLCDWQHIQQMLLRCCSIKARVVESDEKESGVRAMLNFGHTVGHALEAATEYGYFLHGEAVAHGMRAAAWISAEMGMLSGIELTQVLELCEKLTPPPIPDFIDEDILMTFMRYDKKRSQSSQLWVLLDGIGHASLRQDVPMACVGSVLRRLLHERVSAQPH